jgi:hypothetical protein
VILKILLLCFKIQPFLYQKDKGAVATSKNNAIRISVPQEIPGSHGA